MLDVSDCKAGLEIGEMILAVNKEPLLGSNYENVSDNLLNWGVLLLSKCGILLKYV